MRLAKREKQFVALGSTAILIFVTVHLAVIPFQERKRSLIVEVEAMERGLKEMKVLAVEYEKRRRETLRVIRVLSDRPAGFALFTFLERAAAIAGVGAGIEYMKPSSSKASGQYEQLTVEMKLGKITTEQLVKFLYQIESTEGLVGVKRLSITENRNEDGFVDAVFHVVTYR